MSKPKILYVDDEIINLQLFIFNLEDRYTVLTAENGIDGLRLLSDNPDTKVVISDMKMPMMHGIEFIKKAKEKYPEIKYFILTGYDINSEIQEALDSELIIDCFIKPFKMDKIDAEIKKVINS